MASRRIFPATWPNRIAPPRPITRDELLLVHGSADDNVHPDHSTALVARLIDEGKPFDDALYPGQKHGFAPAASRHFYERMTEFFDRHLRPGS